MSHYIATSMTRYAKCSREMRSFGVLLLVAIVEMAIASTRGMANGRGAAAACGGGGCGFR